MKNFLLQAVLLLLCALSLQGIDVKTPFFKAEFSAKGAMMTALSCKNTAWVCQLNQWGSFTDRIGQNIGKSTQGLADTAALDFTLKEYTVSKKETKVTFSALIGLIPDLRMEKSYIFSAEKPVLTVEYRFTNEGKKALPLTLYTRSFFRYSNGKNAYYHPGENGMKKIMPGETSLPVKLPRQTCLALADEAGKGLLLRYPADDTSGLLNWLFPGGYTQEFLSSQQNIQPGKSRTIVLNCSFEENILSVLQNFAPNAKPLKGEIPVQVDRMCGINRKAGLCFYRSIPAPKGAFMDCTFRRQAQDSWRAIELSADKAKGLIAVYPLINNIADTSAPMEFCRKNNTLLIKIPGLFNGRQVHFDRFKEKDDFVYNGSTKTWHGPVTLKCRILFGGPAGKETAFADIPAEGAMIRNGNMEKASPRNKNIPAFVPAALNRFYQISLLKEADGNTVCRIGKNLAYDFFPEHRKEYQFSARVRSIGGGGLSRIFIQFFDKNGKYLQRQRLIVLASQKTFGWKKYERRFYVPDNAAFLRILFLNGQRKGQYLDIDDVKLTLPAETQQSVARKTVLRNELLKLWTIPLPLLEEISHDLVTPHEKWFKPAAAPVENVLFLSSVGNRITEGGRRTIVELAQRLDLKYTHIPLIRKINNVVSAYSVYPTHFGNRISDYTMECLKEIKKLPRTVVILNTNFNLIKGDKAFIDLLTSWQKKGVNFLFISCSYIPVSLTGKAVQQDFAPVLPAMSAPPKGKPGFYSFSRNHKSLVCVVRFVPSSSTLIPDNLRFEASYYALHYSFDFPWWEYHTLLNVQLLRHLAQLKNEAKLVKTAAFAAVKAQKDFSGTLEVDVETMSRETILSRKIPVKAAANQTVGIPDDFALPGGVFVAKLRLLDTKGRAVDAGAVRLDRKETVPVTVTMKNKENIVPHPQKAEFTVSAPALPPGAKVAVEIFNQRSEVIFRSEPKSEKTIAFAVELPLIRTFFNYIRARVIKDGRVLATVTKEFSVPQIPVALNEFYGFTNPGLSAGAPIKDLGFDFVISGDPRWKHTPVSIRRTRTIGLIPIPRRGDEKMFRPYRDDVKSDPVRKPCFSSPEFHAQLQKDTKFIADNCKVRYNDVNLLWAGDEMFLGRSVCTSPSCLAGFRKEMEKSFGTIAALNANWGTNFKSFAEVVPQQLDQLKDKNALGPWLDHKMYMTKVFAENFFGKPRAELEKYVPNVKIGPTGTQKPGFGYNWHELMKYCRIVGYYSGVQTKVIHDFGGDQLLAGQCGGGYTHGHMDFEPYNYDIMWTTLLNGGNLAYHYHGCAMKGDGSPTRNMRFFSNSLKELKSGIGKLYLSAKPDFKVAILYSQPSLFAAMGSSGQDEWQNSQTSWNKLLEDLRISGCFINYEELADKGVPAGIKAVVLPFSLALSDKEIASLKRFADKGGLVIADWNAGIFDGHGKKRTEAEHLAKLKFVKNLGFSVARYNFVQAGGTGGELSSSFSGDEKFISLCRSKVKELLGAQKIFSFVELADERGREFGCIAKFRQDGPTKIYGFHQTWELKPALFKDFKPVMVSVKLPQKGHVYEVRSKRYVGHTDHFKMPLIPQWSMIYAVLPVKPETLKVTLPAAVASGSSFKAAIALSPAKGAQVFRVTLLSPEGKELAQFAKNHRFEGPAGSVEFFMPYNFKKGKYTVKATHIATGKTSSAVFEVR